MTAKNNKKNLTSTRKSLFRGDTRPQKERKKARPQNRGESDDKARWKIPNNCTHTLAEQGKKRIEGLLDARRLPPLYLLVSAEGEGLRTVTDERKKGPARSLEDMEKGRQIRVIKRSGWVGGGGEKRRRRRERRRRTKVRRKGEGGDIG